MVHYRFDSNNGPILASLASLIHMLDRPAIDSGGNSPTWTVLGETRPLDCPAYLDGWRALFPAKHARSAYLNIIHKVFLRTSIRPLGLFYSCKFETNRSQI